MSNFRYYIIPDLMTWTQPLSGQPNTPIEYYNTLTEAKSRYEQLREQPYNNEMTRNENTGEPYSRLTLGIDRTDKPSSIDILHVRNGVNYLVDDYRRIDSMKSDPEFMAALQQIAAEIGFDRVRPYLPRKDERGNERLVPGKDQHITDWVHQYDLGSDLHYIRFPSVMRGDLFKIRDGQQITQCFPDGMTNRLPCKWRDDYHVTIGFRTWHIQEYAEACFRQGFVVRPEHPQPGDNLDIFSIYQLRRDSRCEYRFGSYDEAKGQSNAADYDRKYIGSRFADFDLEKIYSIFNRDDRPCGRSMHSLSMSDIVVINQDGKEQAFYVDRFGFTEVPGFPEALHAQEQQKEQQRDAMELY